MDRDTLLSQLRAEPIRQRIITALDVPTTGAALSLARALGPNGRFVKVGLELYSAAGPPVIAQLQDLGKEIFLDLKLHDIPNTVAGAALVAAKLDVAMLTIHASGGRRILQAAADALAAAGQEGDRRPALLGVTVLTSLTAEEMQEVAPSPEELPQRILRLARLAWECGCDGIVCSPTDLPLLRAELGPEPLIITPGIRPESAERGDQRRTATPGAAVAAGADFLVIGRPITKS
jgi:orotidine-5'-phosphate decarboxylase